MTVAGGTVPKQHDGWMWDLTVPGNNDHDFYVVSETAGNVAYGAGYDESAGTAQVLVHNATPICRHSNLIGKIGDSRFGDVLAAIYPKDNIIPQFKIQTPYGERIVDYLAFDEEGTVDLFEVKTNTSQYTKVQQQKDAWIEQEFGWPTTVVRLNEACPICSLPPLPPQP